MLKCNTRNLPVRQSHVDYLASEMAAGRWHLTHQGIAFDSDVLVDGQHRLLAVVQSGVTIQAWVFGDVPLAVQCLVDKGRVRSIADELFHFEGVTNAKLKASACRAVILMCCDYQRVKMSAGACNKVLTELEKEFEFVIEAVGGFRAAKKKWVIASLALAVSADKQLEQFVRSVGDGQNLKKGDPALTLREWLTNGCQNLDNGYMRPAVECIFNAAFNASIGNRLSLIKRGSNGFDHFIAKKRKLQDMIQVDMCQQLESEAN